MIEITALNTGTDKQQDLTKAGNLSNIDYHNVRKVSLILRSLNHKMRQQILEIINDTGKITVTDIYVRLRLEQSVTSQHLAILRKAGIVFTQREGKFVYYTINEKRIHAVERFLKDVSG